MLTVALAAASRGLGQARDTQGYRYITRCQLRQKCRPTLMADLLEPVKVSDARRAVRCESGILPMADKGILPIAADGATTGIANEDHGEGYKKSVIIYDEDK